jgi:hypothetical protein
LLDIRVRPSTAGADGILRRSIAMFAIEVDPKWYENYWLRAQPRGERRSFFEKVKVALFAALVILLAGGGLVLDY